MDWRDNFISMFKAAAPAAHGVYTTDLKIDLPPTLTTVLGAIRSYGGKVRRNVFGLLVGGAVRDRFLGMSPKDFDVEVYGVSYDELISILTPFDRNNSPNSVGKKFGVIKITDRDGNEYDFSIPRRENKIGVGHKGFNVEFDANITPQEAASRRDFTFNALAYDPLEHQVHDYFGGVTDLDNKMLKATSPAFSEDAVRVLRGMQFAGRFGFTVDDKTAEMCRALVPSIKDETIERISGEWMKFFTKSKYPGKALEFLVKTGLGEIYPGINNIVDVLQEPEWHPEGAVVRKVLKQGWKGEHAPISEEGELMNRKWWQERYMDQHFRDADRELGPEEPYDPKNPDHQNPMKYVVVPGTVLTHTIHVLDAAAKIADEQNLPPNDRAVLLMAGLCHDLGKAHTTRREEKKGYPRITSPGHEAESVLLAEEFLKSVGVHSDLIQRVLPLVGNHMTHITFDPKSKNANVLQIAEQIFPATIKELEWVIRSDMGGRPPLPGGLSPEAELMVNDAKDKGVYEGKMASFFQGGGGELCQLFNIPPGRLIGDTVKFVREKALQGIVRSREDALRVAEEYIKGKALLISGDDVLASMNVERGGPFVKQILDAAWQAQKGKAFTDRNKALQWLESYVRGMNNEPERNNIPRRENPSSGSGGPLPRDSGPQPLQQTPEPQGPNNLQ